MSSESSIISRVWGMCNPLRDDGVSYGDYLEQLTYLIFLKMSDEYSKPPYNKDTGIPVGYGWADMNTLTGAALEDQYKKTLEKLGEQGGILGQIFQGAINKVSNAAILYRIVQMIDREKWVSMSSDVKGEIYEGLLQKNAEDVKSGAGQYFTPRALIQAMVACLRPEPMKTIADPCCGSGGFFLAAQEYLTAPGRYSLDREQKEFLKNSTFYGNELVPTTFKLCLMNLYLHNIGDIYGSVPIARGDSLLTDPGYRVDYVLTNPPFGKKSSLTFTNEAGEQEEEDLIYTWANEVDRLVVVQHTIGNGLSFAEKENGLPNKAILEELNRQQNEEMRHGYLLGIENQRGVHWVDPEGKPERKLAEQFAQYAARAEELGFSRVAEMFKKISRDYIREAEENVLKQRLLSSVETE